MPLNCTSHVPQEELMHLLEASTLKVAFPLDARQKLATAALNLMSDQQPRGESSNLSPLLEGHLKNLDLTYKGSLLQGQAANLLLVYCSLPHKGYIPFQACLCLDLTKIL